MKKHLFLCLRWAMLLGAALVLVAQTDQISPFTGTWNMSLTKSRFNPGPPFQSFTIAFTPDGARHLDWTGADGQSIKALLPWSDGKEVAVKGIENTTASSKIQGKTFHDVWKQNGRIIEDVHGGVSSDGRTLTTTVDGTDTQGRAYHNQLTFEKQ